MKATWALLCAAAMAAAGCGSSSSSTAGRSSSTAASPTTSSAPSTAALSPGAAPQVRRPRHQPKPVPSGPKLRGFGATTAEWDAAHTAVPGFAPGTVYDADPNLPQVNGHEGSRYYAVLHEGGRVLQYDMAFANLPVSQIEAQIVASEFPPDAHKVWFAVKDSCAQMLVQSSILGRALGSKAVGDRAGTVLIEFSSGAADTSYDAERVNDALFMLAGYTAQSSAPAC